MEVMAVAAEKNGAVRQCTKVKGQHRKNTREERLLLFLVFCCTSMHFKMTNCFHSVK